MFAADTVHPTIDEVIGRPITDPGTAVAQSIQAQPGQAIPEDIVDKITGKKAGIPTWLWLLGGGALAYFLFFRK